MTCRYCCANNKLVKSHIIPEAFFRELREKNEAPILISNIDGDRRKRTPVGIYDPHILCGKCEKELERYDDYAIKVLLKDFDSHFTPLLDNSTVIGYASNAIDQKKLSKFFISLLWRASITKKPFYSKVDLGPLEEIARAVLQGQAPHEEHRFATVLTRWQASSEHDPLTAALLSPFCEQWDEINAYRFYLGRTVAYIKADNRPYPNYLRQFSLNYQPELVLATRKFDESKDFAVLVNVARDAARKELMQR